MTQAAGAMGHARVRRASVVVSSLSVVMVACAMSAIAIEVETSGVEDHHEREATRAAAGGVALDGPDGVAGRGAREAVEPVVIPLWPEGVPDRRPEGGPARMVDGRLTNVHDPTITYYAPEAGPLSGLALIVCPGGAYVRLAIDNEAAGVVERLQPLGVAVFVLAYRVEYAHPSPLRDVLRAVRIVRSRAAEFGVSPSRVGVFGASAGGHLALSAATLFEAVEGRTGAAIDEVSGRPDFVAVLYPVVTMREPLAHAVSRRSLLGEAPGAAIVERLSADSQVSAAMPPVFLVHTLEDVSVPVEHSLRLIEAMRRAGVAFEAHVYERGPHGFGTREDVGTASGWVARLAEWLVER